MRIGLTSLLLLSVLGLANAGLAQTDQVSGSQPDVPKILDQMVIGKVWSPVKVGFTLMTQDDRQFIVYYNADRRTVVAMREFGDDKFQQQVLPSRSDQPPTRNDTSTIQGWDSHNYWAIAVDSTGHLHMAGNMHANPLTYFRSTRPFDITSLVQVDNMVGTNEKHCTYPKFKTTADGRLLFHYRDGWSGNGGEIYNIYDAETKTWSRFLETNLIDGQGKDNAYQRGPKLGPDGYYHLLWMWRATHDVATNHIVCYAKSRDLKHWETAAGEPLKLPITKDDKGTYIDPVPQKGGLHNGAHGFTFDRQGRPVVTYFKHTPDDTTQAFAARFENGDWKIQQISDWQGKYIFYGGGTAPKPTESWIRLRSPRQWEDDKLAVAFGHWKAGEGLLLFDEQTLIPTGIAPTPDSHIPNELREARLQFPGIQVNFRGGPGNAPGKDYFYLLRWETLGSNRDRPRDKPWPDNTDLVLYKIQIPGAAN